MHPDTKLDLLIETYEELYKELCALQGTDTPAISLKAVIMNLKSLFEYEHQYPKEWKEVVPPINYNYHGPSPIQRLDETGVCPNRWNYSLSWDSVSKRECNCNNKYKY